MIIGVTVEGRLAVRHAGRVWDVTALLDEQVSTNDPLATAIRQGLRIEPDRLAGLPNVAEDDVRWTAPLRRPGKILGAPANYFEHVDEMPNSATVVEWGLFLKAGTSVIGPDERVRLPYHDVRTDYEGELAVVIGRSGKDIPIERALDHVYGYTALLDITIRSSEDRSTRKSFDTFTPLGPWVVTADDVGEPDDIGLQLFVNGRLRQQSDTSKLIYGVRELIAYASSVMTLEPGDVIATGTPAGVGPLGDGDHVRLELDRIGSLAVDVTAEGAIAYADRPGPRSALQRE